MDHGGCRISARRESTRTSLRLLQQNEKNSVRLNETCTRNAVGVATRAHDDRATRVNRIAQIRSNARAHEREMKKAAMK
jgi:hypothetical protein